MCTITKVISRNDLDCTNHTFSYPCWHRALLLTSAESISPGPHHNHEVELFGTIPREQMCVGRESSASNRQESFRRNRSGGGLMSSYSQCCLERYLKMRVFQLSGTQVPRGWWFVATIHFPFLGLYASSSNQTAAQLTVLNSLGLPLISQTLVPASYWCSVSPTSRLPSIVSS